MDPSLMSIEDPSYQEMSSTFFSPYLVDLFHGTKLFYNSASLLKGPFCFVDIVDTK